MHAVFLLVLALIVFSCAHANKGTADRPDEDVPTVTVSKWQYCYGCQQTNIAYANSIVDMLKKVVKGGGKDRVVNSDEALNLLCDRPYFDDYYSFVRHSCMKIVGDHGIEMATQYSGNTNTAFLSSKKEVYQMSKQVCVDVTGACSPNAFKEVPVPARQDSKKKAKCTACKVVATDLDGVRKGVNNTDDIVMRNYLEEKFCSTLGYRHQPYSWLESICDEMIEDYTKQILEIFEFQNKLSLTPFKMDNNMADAMCEEFYGCEVPKPSLYSAEL